jgi:hypothetical protein
MPRVGNKRFPYTPEGYKQAAQEKKRTGMDIEYETGTAELLGDDLERMATNKRPTNNNARMAPRQKNRTQRPSRRMRY